MRIQIKTKYPVKDNDLRALYLIKQAMEISTPRMRQENLDFVLNRNWREFDSRLSRSEQSTTAKTSKEK